MLIAVIALGAGFALALVDALINYLAYKETQVLLKESLAREDVYADMLDARLETAE